MYVHCTNAGLLGGPLCVLNPATGSVRVFSDPISNQSVVALVTHQQSGLIVGGTAIKGGGGSHATTHAAKLFVWSPAEEAILLSVVPAGSCNTITALAVGRNGLIYGTAVGCEGGRASSSSSSVLFAFNLTERRVVSATPTDYDTIYNAIGTGSDGRLYGLATTGVFTIDEREHIQQLLAGYARGISGGFAIDTHAGAGTHAIYFADGPQIVSYTLPPSKPG